MLQISQHNRHHQFTNKYNNTTHISRNTVALFLSTFCDVFWKYNNKAFVDIDSYFICFWHSAFSQIENGYRNPVTSPIHQDAFVHFRTRRELKFLLLDLSHWLNQFHWYRMHEMLKQFFHDDLVRVVKRCYNFPSKCSFLLRTFTPINFSGHSQVWRMHLLFDSGKSTCW